MKTLGDIRPGRACAALFAALCASCVTPPWPETPRFVNMSVGRIGVNDAETYPVARVEYRLEPFSEWLLVPTMGLTVDNDSASFISGGLTRDFWLDAHWVAVPSFSAGLFDDGDHLQLGSDLEFRSGIELAYTLDSGVRFGFGLFHLSNGGIAERNPGTESLMFSIGVPVGK